MPVGLQGAQGGSPCSVVVQLQLAVRLEEHRLPGTARELLRNMQRVDRAGTAEGVEVVAARPVLLVADPRRPTARDPVKGPVLQLACILRVLGQPGGHTAGKGRLIL